MNNLRKEVSAIILNDTDFERAVSTLMSQVMPPLVNAVPRTSDTKSPYKSACCYVVEDLLRKISIISDENDIEELREIQNNLFFLQHITKSYLDDVNKILDEKDEW